MSLRTYHKCLYMQLQTHAQALSFKGLQGTPTWGYCSSPRHQAKSSAHPSGRNSSAVPEKVPTVVAVTVDCSAGAGYNACASLVVKTFPVSRHNYCARDDDSLRAGNMNSLRWWRDTVHLLLMPTVVVFNHSLVF